MTTVTAAPLSPVPAVISEHVETVYTSWRRGAVIVATRSGSRYRSHDVADLFRPVLLGVGLRVAYDDYTDAEIFCTPDGRHWTQERVKDLLFDSVGSHPDGMLLDALASRSFYAALRSALPDYDGPIQRDRKPSTPSGVEQSEANYVADYLREWVTEPTRATKAFELYEDFSAGDDRDPLGRTTFYRVAVESGLVERRRRSYGDVFVPVNR